VNKVSIVILNYNGQRFLEEFLPSVIANSAGHQIIVADNASTDNSLPFLKENYPDIRVIELPKNGGFAGGYNAALNQVVSEYYVLLNSDIEVTTNWIEPMLDILNKIQK
jgi:Predicted glycosyltransferases